MIKTRLVLLGPRGRSRPLARRRLRRRQRARAPTRPAWRPGARRSSSKATVQPTGELKSNIEALAQEDRRDRRPRRTDRLRARKLGRSAPANRSTSKRKSSPGWAKRPASSSRATTATTSPATASRSRPPTPAPTQDFIDKQAEAERRPGRRRLLRRGRLQGRRRRRHRGRRGRRLPRLRRGRAGLQGRGRRLRGRIAGRRRQPTRAIVDAAPDGSLADVYVDIGGLIDSRAATIDPTRSSSSRAPGSTRGSDRGGQPRAGLRPGRDRPQQRPRRRGPAHRRRLRLLGSMPADSFAAFAVGRLRQAARGSDRQTRRRRDPGEIPPHKLKSSAEAGRHRPRKDRRLVGDARRLRRRQQRGNLGGAARPDHQGRRRSDRTPSPTSAPCCAPPAPPGVTAISGNAQRLLDPQRRPRPQAAGRRRQGRADRDRLRPAGDASQACAGLGPDPRRQRRLQGSGQRARRHPDHRLRRRPRGAAASPTRWSRPTNRKASKKRSPTWTRSTSWRSAPAARAIWRRRS